MPNKITYSFEFNLLWVWVLHHANVKITVLFLSRFFNFLLFCTMLLCATSRYEKSACMLPWYNSRSLSVGSVINEMQSKMTDRLTGLCSRVVPRQGCLRRNEASRRLTPPAANLTATSSRRRSWPITFRRVVFNLFTHVYIRCWSNSMLRVAGQDYIWCVYSPRTAKNVRNDKRSSTPIELSIRTSILQPNSVRCWSHVEVRF